MLKEKKKKLFGNTLEAFFIVHSLEDIDLCSAK